jgi:hypothetical protein
MLLVDLALHEFLSGSHFTILSTIFTVSSAFFINRLVLAMLLIDTTHIRDPLVTLHRGIIGSIALSLLKLVEKVLRISILPFAFLEVMRHSQRHVEVTLYFTVLRLLVPHLVDDHSTQESVVLLNARSLNVVRILEIGRLEVQAWTGRHQVNYDLNETLLLKGINDMLVGLHISMNE